MNIDCNPFLFAAAINLIKGMSKLGFIKSVDATPFLYFDSVDKTENIKNLRTYNYKVFRFTLYMPELYMSIFRL